MKHLVRSFLFNVFALWFTGQILPAFSISGSWQTLLFAGLVLSLLMLVIKPVLKILFIPINIITFGLLSWIINVIVVYLLTLLVAQVQVTAWIFPGVAMWGFVIPQISLSYIASLILSTFSITFFSSLLHSVSGD
jgi:putative membrane protein